MLAKGRMDVVLPACEDEAKDLEPIIFHTPAVYNDKVKVHDWQMQTLASPRDNKEIFPPKGNLHKSSYKRLGPDIGCTGMTATQEMLSQIELKDLYKTVYPQRTLFHMKTLASEVEEEKEVTLMDIMYDQEMARCMDYRTTSEIDYRSPHPMKPRKLPPPPPPEPWLLNRRPLSCIPHDLARREGVHTFLDDGMDIYRKIADVKSKRYKVHSFQSEVDESIDLSDIKRCDN
ncbi:uncharacterized protein LOC108624602 [Ceratina calcarata]|uniref:Uncharacterized protein LOC108624602 n=1 Tax=Ceratina calcarata TaxID=156304 RepID=A0AAJ7N656_9HYME|nr:uncharacterized protein LOC108624602 [Ceratina calcarata]